MKIEHLPVTPELFTRLPESLQHIQRDFNPTGSVSVTYSFHNESAGQWHRHFTVVPEPEQSSASFNEFPYKLEHLKGIVEEDSSSTQEPVIKVDLVGYAGTQPIYIRGQVKGDKPYTTVALDVWGDDVPLDDKLMAALPAKYQTLARSFRPTGLSNFKAFIRGSPDKHKFSNRYVVAFHHATVRYDVFPYPLEDVTGVLDIQPDHWEFRDFRGTHKGCEFRTQGHSRPEPAATMSPSASAAPTSCSTRSWSKLSRRSCKRSGRYSPPPAASTLKEQWSVHPAAQAAWLCPRSQAGCLCHLAARWQRAPRPTST